MDFSKGALELVALEIIIIVMIYYKDYVRTNFSSNLNF